MKDDDDHAKSLRDCERVRVAGAARTLREIDEGAVTFQHNYSMGMNHWFVGADEQYYGTPQTGTQ